MNWCYITFRSITPAQRGEAVLQRIGIRATLRRTPSWMAEQGCGYCLVVRPKEAVRGMGALKSGQVPFRKLYLLDADGNAEELTV